MKTVVYKPMKGMVNPMRVMKAMGIVEAMKAAIAITMKAMEGEQLKAMKTE